MSVPAPIRIFISSPGDVAEERVLATKLVRRLADEFAGRACLEPVIWEAEPLLATSTFQSQIPRPSECQIVLHILWSRLGTRLPASIARPDGTRYSSGTEYEFEDAVEGFRRNGWPDLLVYRKTAEPVVSLKDEKEVLDRLEQRRALDRFVNQWFHDSADGSLKAAFHPFATSAQFEQIVEEHLRKLILRRLPAGGGEASRPKVSWTGGSPFRGLEVFQFEHAPIFFGRTRAAGDVIAALRKQAAEGRAFVLVSGISGGGKSSLVRAGVLPLLVQPGVIEGVGLWRRAVLRPGDAAADPFLGLAQALLGPDALPELAGDGTTPAQLARQLRDHPAAAAIVRGALAQAAALVARDRQLPQPPVARLILVADQLEELFTTRGISADDQQAFTAVLGALARSKRCWIICTVRADLYHRCLEQPELVALMAGAGQYALLPPTAAEIGQMIRQPAQAAGLSFEQDPQTAIPLDEMLREAAAQNPESLPLLEFALQELYDKRTPCGQLSLDAYRQLGGVEGALAVRAEQVFNSLSPEVREQLPRVLRAIVSFDREHAVRKPADIEVFSGSTEARELVDAFIAARLFTADRGPAGTPMVQIAHEALLRHWPRVVQWLADNAELLRVRARVSTAAAQWQSENQRPDLLLGHGKPLDEARSLLASLGQELTPLERDFVRASTARSRRTARLKTAAIVTLVVLLVLAGAAALVADRERVRANRSAKTADENSSVAIRNGQVAERNAVEARHNLVHAILSEADKLDLAGRHVEAGDRYAELYNRVPQFSDEAMPVELGLMSHFAVSPPPLLALGEHRIDAGNVAFSRDGREALTANNNGTVTVWDLQTGKEVRTLMAHDATVLAFSPDGKLALFGGADGATLWNVQEGKKVRNLGGTNGFVLSAAFSPNGSLALIGAFSGATLWDVRSGKLIRTFYLEGYELHNVESASFSHDGRMALSAVSGVVKLWNVQSGKEVQTLRSKVAVNSVAFSQNDRMAITGGYDDEASGEAIEVWDLQSGQVVRTIRTLVGANRFNLSRIAFSRFAFSRNGRLALSGGLDGNLTLWEVPSAKEVRAFTMRAPISSAAFSPDGRLALMTSTDGALTLWDVEDPPGVRALIAAAGPVVSAAFAPDGRVALTGGADGTTRLWDVETGNPLRTLLGHRGAVRDVAFSADGTIALTGNADGTLGVWDIAGAENLRILGDHGTLQMARSIRSVALSSDGRWALSGDEDGTMRFWDVANGHEVRALPAGPGGRGHFPGSNRDYRSVVAVAISRDGQLGVGDVGGIVRIWDPQTGKELRHFSASIDEQGTAASSVAFSHDGAFALLGANDGTIDLWDLSSGHKIRRLTGHPKTILSIAFSSDGRLALSGGGDGTVTLWSLDTGKELRTFAGHHGPVHSVAFSGDGLFALSGGDDGIAELWDFGWPAHYMRLSPQLATARKALERNPHDASAILQFAQWYAFRGVDDWAVELFDRARASGADVSPLTEAQCAWGASDLDNAHRFFKLALARTHDRQEGIYIRLCLGAINNKPSAVVAFWWQYMFQPQPGPRQWVKVDESHWQEHYPDGHADTFVVVGSVTDGPDTGTIVQRQPDRQLEVLIPPLNEGAILKFRNAGAKEWGTLGPIHLPPATRPASQPTAN